jgi:hypothetical protein
MDSDPAGGEEALRQDDLLGLQMRVRDGQERARDIPPQRALDILRLPIQGDAQQDT